MCEGALVPGFERNKERYRYLPTDDKVSTMPSILKILMNFIETKGPFDGLIGYSEGGLVAGTLLVMEAMRELPGGSRFKCGIFFCAPPPMDTKRALKIGSKARSLHVSIDGVIFDLPTAHIWAKGSDVYPGMGKDLVGLCAPAMREEVVHDLGHVVPGAGTGEILKESIRAIQRTIERARCM